MSVTRPLAHAINNGNFASRATDRLDDIRNHEDGWYSKKLRSHGKEQAEASLNDLDQKNGTSVFAAAVESVAKSILNLAEVDEQRIARFDEEAAEETANSTNRRRQEKPEPLVKQIYVDDHMDNFPELHSLRGGTLFLAENPITPGCGCMQPKGSSVFGPGGELGLRAIGVATRPRSGERSRLLLILPHPEYRRNHEKTNHSFAVVSIATDGYTSGSMREFFLYQQSLEFALGEITAENMIGGSTSSSGVSMALGFPDSHEYLMRHIGDLGNYLTDAANKLKGTHSH